MRSEFWSGKALPNALETHLGLVGGSTFDLDWVHRHTDSMVAVAQDQSVEFIVRKSTWRVCARGKRLAIDHKLEGQCYTNLASNVSPGSRTQYKKANDCEQNTREFHFHNFSCQTFGFSLLMRAALDL
jgi:hypothetical protein